MTTSWRIECCDCLDFLRTLPDGSVDAVVCDPPYGVDIAPWDSDIPPQHFIDECLRVASGAVVLFGAAARILDAASYVPRPQRVLTWCPKFTLSATASNGIFWRYHPIWCWRLPKKRYQKSPTFFGDVLWHNTGGRNEWDHPCTKPIDLMVDLVRAFVPENGTALDPFTGSGTTGVACIQTGRNFIGCEIDAGYAEIARRRCREAEESVALLAGGTK